MLKLDSDKPLRLLGTKDRAVYKASTTGNAAGMSFHSLHLRMRCWLRSHAGTDYAPGQESCAISVAS